MNYKLYSDFRKPDAFTMENLYYTDGIGIITNDKFYLEREKFRNNLIMYVLKGAMYVVQNGKHKINEGSYVLMRLTKPHIYYAQRGIETKVMWMHFADRPNRKLLDYIEKEEMLPYIGSSVAVKEKLMDCIEASQNSNPSREFCYSIGIYDILLETIKQVKEKKETSSLSSEESFKVTAKSYMEAKIYEKPDLLDFSKEIGFSQYHFIRLFKKYFKQTPIRYFYEQKIEYSKAHLSYLNEPINEIAIRYGFESQSHYSKLFKELTGQTPSEFRKGYTW